MRTSSSQILFQTFWVYFNGPYFRRKLYFLCSNVSKWILQQDLSKCYIYAKLNQGLTFTLTRDNRAMPGLTYTFQKIKIYIPFSHPFFFFYLIDLWICLHHVSDVNFILTLFKQYKSNFIIALHFYFHSFSRGLIIIQSSTIEFHSPFFLIC